MLFVNYRVKTAPDKVKLSTAWVNFIIHSKHNLK